MTLPPHFHISITNYHSKIEFNNIKAMKLSIRMLDQRTITLEMNETEDVRTLKQRLSSLSEVALPPENVQLIYSGRIMEDAMPLSEYRIAEGRIIVLMGKKKVDERPPVEQVSPPSPLAAGPIAMRTQDVTPSIASNEQLVRELMSMGYGEQDVRSALRASFNHPERAIEYLINGIPQEASPQQELAEIPSGQSTEELQHLMADPRLTRMREMIRENPELMQLIMERLAETDPAAFEAVQHDQEGFMSMLSGAAGSAGGASHNPDEGEHFQVALSAEEAAAVERLEALGFERVMAVQAYLACDKDEQLAAEVLFRESEEDRNE
ncbi:UV excision repair protein RAD23 homolog B [Drosophila yakuba]|nr:UV excision repair protein RAD23 homolog B [Drosophila yakuba]